jgi:hypothetical protein
MTMKKTTPSWSDLKPKFADFDRAALLSLVQALYSASKDNQAFLHTRFAVGGDVLKPYKETISRWICPDVTRNQMWSVSKAKKAIADYKKALGQPEGLAELSTFYCEEAFALMDYCGVDDEGFFDALVRMLEQALKYATALPKEQRDPFLLRLKIICHKGRDIGWGVGDDFGDLFAQYGADG